MITWTDFEMNIYVEFWEHINVPAGTLQITKQILPSAGYLL